MTYDPAPPGAAPEPAIVLDMWSDVVCPWCYIGKTRLRAAIDAWERPHEVLLRHRAFELDPTLAPGERVPVVTYLGRKYGGGDQAGVAMTNRIASVAASTGLRVDFTRAVKSNTFDAHRLIALGLAAGGPAQAEAILERLFSAHFAEGLAVDDHVALLRLCAEAGLDERRVSAVLAEDTYAEEVRADEEQARALGVTSVPFVIANGRVALSGAQSVEAFTELLRSALEPD